MWREQNLNVSILYIFMFLSFSMDGIDHDRKHTHALFPMGPITWYGAIVRCTTLPPINVEYSDFTLVS